MPRHGGRDLLEIVGGIGGAMNEGWRRETCPAGTPRHNGDHKAKRDSRDRDTVSADEDYEVEYFAQKNGITPENLILRHGNSRGL